MEKGKGPEWYKYFLCGIKGVFAQFQDEQNSTRHGMQIIVSGNVPPASGLSSSSALVCAATLATNNCYQVNFIFL